MKKKDYIFLLINLIPIIAIILSAIGIRNYILDTLEFLSFESLGILSLGR